MEPVVEQQASEQYSRCIEASKRVRWDIDDDVIRGRTFDLSHKFLPDGLSLVEEIECLSPDEKRYLSQVQGRTYANIFGLVERFIVAKVIELGGEYALGDQVAMEALVRFSDEELKHQELFRRIDALAAAVMPEGYEQVADANDVANSVLAQSTWAVLALTLHIELFTQAHYRESIGPESDLSPLFKDVFFFHWKEECQHALMDEVEWRREHAGMSAEERDEAVDEFIALVGAVDGILQGQAKADTGYFAATCGRSLSQEEREAVEAGTLKAYRWQYILSGAQHPYFGRVLSELVTDSQMGRIHAALGTLM